MPDDWSRTESGSLVKRYGRTRNATRLQADFPTPMVIGDKCDLQSMANGQWYDSKSALAKSYQAENNPQGRDYTVIGETPIEGAGPAKPDKKAIRAAVEKSLHDVKAGNVPEHIREIK
jgi:hypothetical protein